MKAESKLSTVFTLGEIYSGEPPKKNQKREENLQLAVCKYLDFKYPNVIYTSDLSGIKLSIGSAVKAKKGRCKRFKIPDLLILEPNKYSKGLFLELKASKDELYLKDGVTIRKSEHIEAQVKTLNRLFDLGYCAFFACGLESAIERIDYYMNNR